MPKFQPFELERIMSEWEQVVEYNLSESGAHPLKLSELLAYDPSVLDQMLDTELGYGYAEGTPELREKIAQWYPGASAENVLVTIGCVEATMLAYQTLISSGDQVAIEMPNYLHGWGVAKNMEADIRPFGLDADRQWALNEDQLNEAVTHETKMIAVCNPNNPTGQILSEDEMDAVIDASERTGAWILADEIYAGAERVRDEVTPSFYDKTERVLALGSMSKAYGLPGLRLGWIVGPSHMIENLWKRHEYLTISTAKLSNHFLAPLALRADVRPKIFDRTRQFIRDGWSRYEPWLNENTDLLSLVAPQAAAISFVKYNLKIDSISLAQRLIKDGSVLIGPGDYFGVPNHIRISYGLPHDYLMEGLSRISQVLRAVAEEEGGVAAGA